MHSDEFSHCGTSVVNMIKTDMLSTSTLSAMPLKTYTSIIPSYNYVIFNLTGVVK